MKTLAIIPARGGSKRIPRKNIRLFCGKPIIEYSILAAKESKLFDTIMVSTDDKEIAKIVRSLGAEVPFMRSNQNSNDYTSLIEVLKEVITEYKKKDKIFDIICCILPTAPTISVEDLQKSYKLLLDSKSDSVITVTPFEYPIQRALILESNGLTRMICSKNYNTRSQDLPITYHDAGQFYWIRPEVCFRKNKLFTNNTTSLIIPSSRVQDIDTEEDWKLCEEKYERLH